MARKSFVFYGSFFEAIKELEDKDKGIISYAIMQYGLTGETPKLTGYLKSMFLLIKPQIDANNERYENGCKGAEYGKLGGRPKSKKSIDKQRENGTEGNLENPIETPTKPLNNPTQTPNEDVDVNEDDNENEDVDVNGKEECKGKNQRVSDPKDQNKQNDKRSKASTDFSFGEKQGTANDRTANGTTNDTDFISSTSPNTFKARVEYAKSLGIEEGVARRICNFAQSKKLALCEMHYKGFAGKSGKEVEEAFNLLKFLAKRVKDPRGKSSRCQGHTCQGHNGLRHINSG